MHKPCTKFVVVLSLFALILSGCQNTPKHPTIQFSEQGCQYSGPDRISPQFTIIWKVEASVNYGAILEIFSIDSAYDREDLASMPAAHPLPEWITKLSYDYAFEPGNYSTSIDLTSNAAWNGEEIYIVCFSSLEDEALDAFGPIKVKN